MNASDTDRPFPGERSGFDSLDSEILIIDLPGDATVCPPSPLLLKLGMAERERMEQGVRQAVAQGESADTHDILIIDGPGDTTVRPPSPLQLKLGMAERERIARWEEYLKKQPDEGRIDTGPGTDTSVR